MMHLQTLRALPEADALTVPISDAREMSFCKAWWTRVKEHTIPSEILSSPVNGKIMAGYRPIPEINY